MLRSQDEHFHEGTYQLHTVATGHQLHLVRDVASTVCPEERISIIGNVSQKVELCYRKITLYRSARPKPINMGMTVHDIKRRLFTKLDNINKNITNSAVTMFRSTAKLRHPLKAEANRNQYFE